MLLLFLLPLLDQGIAGVVLVSCQAGAWRFFPDVRRRAGSGVMGVMFVAAGSLQPVHSGVKRPMKHWQRSSSSSAQNPTAGRCCVDLPVLIPVMAWQDSHAHVSTSTLTHLLLRTARISHCACLLRLGCCGL